MDSSWVDATLSLNINTAPACTLKQESPESKISSGDEAVVLEAELNRVSEENRKLTRTLNLMCEKFWALECQVRGVTTKSADKEQHSSSRKRKEEALSLDAADGYLNSSNQLESCSSDDSCKKQCGLPKSKISKAYVRTDPSDSSLVVKDGYQWRKYGQKVTRDNPSPRAYFKCSFAPSCPVKKKVQRSAEDRTLLVATYDGEHNHPHPSQAGSSPAPSSLSAATTSEPSFTLDLIRPRFSPESKTTASPHSNSSPGLHQFIVEQMATSLTKDPNFTTALAAAISGRILQPPIARKW